MQFAFRLVLSDCCKINSRYKREQKRSNKKTDSNGDKIDINLPRNSLNTNIKRGIQQKRCNGKRDWKCLRMVLGPQVESFSFINDEKRIQGGVFFTPEDFERVIAMMADGRIDIRQYAEIITMDDAQDTFLGLDNGTKNAQKYVIKITSE